MKNQKKIYAVTGGSGFIGSHLVRYFADRGNRVRVLIHQSKTDFGKNVEIINGSITDSVSVNKLVKGCDIVFHLASALGNRLVSDEDFFRINVKGTEIVLQESVKEKVSKAVCFSSAGVYGKNPGTVPLLENAKLNPVDIYEKTKLQGEDKALAFKDKINVSVIRPGWVFGEGDRRTFKLIRQIYKGLFFIVGSGKKIHSPIYVHDLILGTIAVSQREENGEVFNIGGEACSINKMCQTIAQALSKKILPFKVPVFLIYPPALFLEKLFKLFNKEAPLTRAKLAFFQRGKPIDSSKSADLLGFKESGSYERNMGRTISWYRDNNWLL